jgi:hypothetical protein
MSKIPSPTVELLRTAVTSRAYAEAERLLGIYRGEMQVCWAAAVSPEDRAAIAAGVGDLLEWARVATLAGRAHAQRKLIHLTRTQAYTVCSSRAPSKPS